MRRPVPPAASSTGGIPVGALNRVRSLLTVTNVGVGGVLLMFVALTTLYAAADRPFFSDESAHTQYGLDVGHGELPTLHDRVTPSIGGMAPTTVYTANHPPLYYLVIAVPLRLGLMIGHPGVGFHAARLCSMLLSVAALILTVMLARRLAPERPVVAVMAAGMMATVPMFLGVSSAVFNDSMIVLTTVSTLLLTVRMIMDGGSGRRLAGVSLSALAACAARITGVVPAAVGAVGAAFVWWRREPEDPPGRRVLRGLGIGAVVGAVITAGISWFYVRNVMLYGDLIGKEVNRTELGYHPADRGVVDVVFDPNTWHSLLATSYSRPGLVGPVLWRVIEAVATVAALSVGWWLLCRLTRRTRPSRTSVACWLACGFVVVATLILLLYYDTEGGPPNPRYLLPALPVVGLLVGCGFGTLPRRVRGPVAAVWLVTASLVAALLVAREVAYQSRLDLSDPWHALAVGLARYVGLERPGPLLAAWAAVFLFGLLSAVGALLLSGRRAPAPLAVVSVLPTASEAPTGADNSVGADTVTINRS